MLLGKLLNFFTVMASRIIVFLLAILLLTCPFTSASAASSPARLVNGLFSNANSMLMKWVKSLKATTKTAISGRPMMKFESGYTVETVFDGSKLGIEPYSLELLPNGELLILDSANSNLYKISSSLSLYSRPKLVAGSSEGYAGHIDGRLREARMNHPKGVTVDDRGNIYIADTDNMAIRKIGDAGITTIAGGKKTRGGSHVDGPSEDARFSNDFDVVYIGSSCSLLVIDRGNQAIREIQLHFDDCAYQYGSGFPLGVAVLIAAGFFGYMLALLQRRVGTMVSSKNDQGLVKNESETQSLHSKPLMRYQVRPPLIPVEGEEEREDESFFNSLGGLLGQTGASALEILKGLCPWLQRKPLTSEDLLRESFQQQQKYSNTWPAQDSYVIREEDEPPSVEARTPTPRKTYAFMSKDPEKMQQLRQSRAFYGGGGWEGNSQQQPPPQQPTQKQQHRHQYHSSIPETCYEQSSENASEIVFGAVQQERKLEAMVIKPLDYENGPYNRHLNRYRVKSMAAYNGH